MQRSQGETQRIIKALADWALNNPQTMANIREIMRLGGETDTSDRSIAFVIQSRLSQSPPEVYEQFQQSVFGDLIFAADIVKAKLLEEGVQDAPSVDTTDFVQEFIDYLWSVPEAQEKVIRCIDEEVHYQGLRSLTQLLDAIAAKDTSNSSIIKIVRDMPQQFFQQVARRILQQRQSGQLKSIVASHDETQTKLMHERDSLLSALRYIQAHAKSGIDYEEGPDYDGNDRPGVRVLKSILSRATSTLEHISE